MEAALDPVCPLADSRLTSGLITVANLLDRSGVCGIPTDTVYALAASCKNPQAIEKIYNIKVWSTEEQNNCSTNEVYVIYIVIAETYRDALLELEFLYHSNH